MSQQIRAPEGIQSQIDVTSVPLLVLSSRGRPGACLSLSPEEFIRDVDNEADMEANTRDKLLFLKELYGTFHRLSA